MARPMSKSRIYASDLGITLDQLHHMGGMEKVKNMPEGARALMVSLAKQEKRRKRLKRECPEGYAIVIPGQNIDMLGKTEYWRIFENHPEPFLTRIPEDFIETENGQCLARIPKEWGKCLYQKLV